MANFTYISPTSSDGTHPQQIADNQIQLQQQRDAARNQALIPNPTVTIDTSRGANQRLCHGWPQCPCFTINQIALTALDHKAYQDSAHLRLCAIASDPR